MVFLNGSNYDYHFIIKEVAKKFEGEFNCVRENTEKYKNLSVPITKEVKRIEKKEKNGEEITIIISYKLQFIDSTRFIASSSSNFVDNLAEGFIKLNANMKMII